MPQDSPHIAELQRRLQADPGSIVFAQLAEEYRRAGQHEEAVACCQAGLARHPACLPARVTLARSLRELGDLDAAAGQFDLVLGSAPDNLPAIRGMAETHQQRGEMDAALEFYKRALALARFDRELEETVNRMVRERAEGGRAAYPGLSFGEATSQLLSAASRRPAASQVPAPPPEVEPRVVGPVSNQPLIDFDALLTSLGAPHASPPLVTDSLLSGSTVVPVVTDSVLPPLPTTVSDDPFAALERTLLTFDQRRSAVPAADAMARAPRDILTAGKDDRAMQELEAWLRALDCGPRASQTA